MRRLISLPVLWHNSQKQRETPYASEAKSAPEPAETVSAHQQDYTNEDDGDGDDHDADTDGVNDDCQDDDDGESQRP